MPEVQAADTETTQDDETTREPAPSSLRLIFKTARYEEGENGAEVLVLYKEPPEVVPSDVEPPEVVPFGAVSAAVDPSEVVPVEVEPLDVVGPLVVAVGSLDEVVGDELDDGVGDDVDDSEAVGDGAVVSAAEDGGLADTVGVGDAVDGAVGADV